MESDQFAPIDYKPVPAELVTKEPVPAKKDFPLMPMVKPKTQETVVVPKDVTLTNKRSKTWVILMLISAMVLVGMGLYAYFEKYGFKAPVTPSVTSDDRRSNGAYSVVIPSGWTEPADANSDMFALVNASLGYSIVVVHGQLGSNEASLKVSELQTREAVVSSLSAKMPEAKLAEYSASKLDGEDAIFVKLTSTKLGSANIPGGVIMQNVYAIHRGELYFITALGPSAKYDQAKESIDSLVSSFRFK